MELYFDRTRRAELLTTPFVLSWIGEAREGDLTDARLSYRRAAWAHWAVENLVGVEGTRKYSALALPGKFYDPKGTGELRARPHLEIAESILATPDPEFPTRLALAGNALIFPWWMYAEVVAAKRVIFGSGRVRGRGSVAALVELLEPRGEHLRAGLEMWRDVCRPQWSTVEELLVTSGGDGLVKEGCGDFTTEEIEAYLPGASELGLEVVFEPKLREKSGVWAARRVGIWEIRGRSGGREFNLGVVTPRLTANSSLADENFDPKVEALAALLVRTLVLRRIATTHLATTPEVSNHRIGVARPNGMPTVAPQRQATQKAYLRSIPSVVGEKTPEASVEAAVGFIQAHPKAEEAWEALVSWSGTGRTLTVSRETFYNAHRRAATSIRRAEEPDRDDINLVLPLAWDDRGRVVRVTFTKADSNWADESR